MQSKRLLMISTDVNIFIEGSAVRLRQIEYAKAYEEVHIIVLGSYILGETALSSNCYAYSTRSRFKLFAPFKAISLGRFIISGRKITEMTCQDPFLTALVGVSLQKQCHIPLEMQVHTDIGSTYFTYTLGNKIRKMLALQYLPKADTIRVVSNKIKEYLVGVLSITDSKIEVRPIFVDTEKIRQAMVIQGSDLHAKYPQFTNIVLMASRIEPEKNIELAIHSWHEVLKNIPQAGLVIVGSGSQQKRLAVLVSKLGITSSVIFESWTNQSTLYSYYKTADVFLNTSLFEGYGMTLVEAYATGCKIVSTDVGVAKEIGANIVDWNKDAIANSILAVLKS